MQVYKDNALQNCPNLKIISTKFPKICQHPCYLLRIIQMYIEGKSLIRNKVKEAHRLITLGISALKTDLISDNVCKLTPV